MEARNISQELEAMIHSKRIPNALIFEADGSGTELEISLEFVKKLLLSNETNPVIQNKMIFSRHTLIPNTILFLNRQNSVS